jgi:hypothetical protein
MSVTFSGGITFTGGGFSFSAAPPSQATAGWLSGGQQSTVVSSVQRITFATDTATATVRGPLNGSRRNHSASGNLNYGYHGGGIGPGPFLTSIDRITYTTDTETASTRGPLNVTRYQSAATGSDSYGYFATGAISGDTTRQSSVSRIDYSNDTATTSNRGPLPVQTYKPAATTDVTTYGWFGGGSVFPAEPREISSVSRITYANDTVTASARGPLSSARYELSATGNPNYGWYAGGYPNSPGAVDRITYATDTAVASIRGPLAAGKYLMAACGNNDYGLYGGGKTGPVSSVQRIDYANDTVTATYRGPLVATTYAFAGSSGVQ